MSIGSATRSEFTKYFTTSAWWVLTLITVAALALMSGGFAAAIFFHAMKVDRWRYLIDHWGKHQLDLVMEGQIDEFIDALRTHYQTEKLQAEAVAV